MKKKLLAALAVLTIITVSACSYENHTNVEVSAGTNSPATINVETSNGEKETTINISSDNPDIISVETNESGQTETTDGNDTGNTETGNDATANTSILPITDDVALSAIQNLCLEENPGLVEIIAEGEYPVYWVVESGDDKQVVVLFRSYTGSQTRYYIDRVSGATYVTDLVPGIIDEETVTGEPFNVRDYISPEGKIAIPGTWQTASIVMVDEENMAPEYYVQFTGSDIVYGHLKDGNFVPEYTDKIFVCEQLASGGYLIKSINSSGVKYTYLTSESDDTILEYYETWDEYDYADKYFGGASLSKCDF